MHIAYYYYYYFNTYYFPYHKIDKRKNQLKMYWVLFGGFLLSTAENS